jgi:hypothetical protein
MKCHSAWEDVGALSLPSVTGTPRRRTDTLLPSQNGHTPALIAAVPNLRSTVGADRVRAGAPGSDHRSAAGTEGHARSQGGGECGAQRVAGGVRESGRDTAAAGRHLQGGNEPSARGGSADTPPPPRSHAPAAPAVPHPSRSST